MQNNDWFGDAAAINARLRAPLTRGEVFALTLSAAIALLFIWVRIDNGGAYYDLSLYLNAANGDFYTFFYGYWSLPFFWVLSRLPIVLSHALWAFFNIGSVFFAARVFGGRTALVLSSFQMFYSLIYGQITGVLVGGIALMYWAMMHKRWYLAGAGLIIAFTKYQFGLVPGIALLLLAETTWLNRTKMLIVPIIVVALSFIMYGNWVLDLLKHWSTAPSDASASISLWRWLGPFALLLWLPAVLIPCRRSTRFILIVATNSLAMPYFQQADLLLLMILPIGAWALMGNLGYVFFIGRFTALQVLAAIPLVIYFQHLVPNLQTCLGRRRGQPSDNARN